MRPRCRRCGRVCHTTPQGDNTFSWENHIYLAIQRNAALTEKEKRWVAHLFSLLREAEKASEGTLIEATVSITIWGKTFVISKKEYISRGLSSLGF